jgi:hypothetical protein
MNIVIELIVLYLLAKVAVNILVDVGDKVDKGSKRWIEKKKDRYIETERRRYDDDEP